MSKIKTDKEYLEDLKNHLVEMESSLTAIVDPADFSHKVKLPFHVMSLREAIAYRIVELTATTIPLFEERKLVSAIILIRGILESVLLLFFVSEKVRNTIDRKKLGGNGKKIMGAIFGGRSWDLGLKSTHVNDTLRSIEEYIPNFNKVYDELCEISHCNLAGIMYSYSRFDDDNLLLKLDPKKYQPPGIFPISILALSLFFFRSLYDGLPGKMKEFSKICESEFLTKS